MAWSSALHPRAPAGAAAGGQFTAGSASSSQNAKAPTKKPKPKAAKLPAGKPKPAKKVRSRSPRTVTVKRGDTLSGIAKRSGESLGQLKKDNPGLFSKAHKGGNLIFPGNKVKLASKGKVKAKPKPKKAVLKKAKPKAAPKVRSTKPKRAPAPKAAPKRAAPVRPRMARSTTSGTRRSSARVVSRGGGVQIAKKKR